MDHHVWRTTYFAGCMWRSRQPLLNCCSFGSLRLAWRKCISVCMLVQACWALMLGASVVLCPACACLPVRNSLVNEVSSLHSLEVRQSQTAKESQRGRVRVCQCVSACTSMYWLRIRRKVKSTLHNGACMLQALSKPYFKSGHVTGIVFLLPTILYCVQHMLVVLVV